MPWKTASQNSASTRAKANAPKLRRAMTDSEKRLWWHLRERLPRVGTHFRRQMAIGPFVVDFVCLERRLVIEVDGEQHETEGAIAYDKRRDAWLQADGFRILRVSSRDVMSDIEPVLAIVTAALNVTTPTPYPSPQGGGDRGKA